MAALREDLASTLAPLSLRLSEAKMRVVHMADGFDFLGFRIQWKRKRGIAGDGVAVGARQCRGLAMSPRWPFLGVFGRDRLEPIDLRCRPWATRRGGQPGSLPREWRR
jgi:hypothetical protein